MADLKRLYHDLVRFETELWAAVDTRLRTDCDLQLTWFEIMQLLGREPGRRVQDIATEFAISVGGTSKVVDRIVVAGFSRRIPNPQDGRSALLELTEVGQQKLAEAVPVFEDELALRFRSVLGEGELERLALNLRLLRTSAFSVEDRLSA
ncbi:MarR family winged helix-turn-helix transcriptional regulator [Promicromonospora alba]|jgi:DNA-binding MarR family transcriptional regulator|uniref:MarR family winged helix-turn-helix transcriptional regulator n=1 Tax=Promicromonospora alba TaxID=1616110 RepID=A0ABV9HDD3_9MICO